MSLTFFNLTRSRRQRLLINSVMIVSDSAIAGAISGISARVISTPLDVIKIRFQLQLEPIRTKVRIK